MQDGTEMAKLERGKLQLEVLNLMGEEGAGVMLGRGGWFPPPPPPNNLTEIANLQLPIYHPCCIFR